MTKAKTGLAGALSAIISLGAAFLVYIHTENLPGVASMLAVLAAGFVAGLLQGAIAGRAWLNTIAISALLGALPLWLPILFVTYGFALLALPALVAFAAVVWMGARLGARRAAKPPCRAKHLDVQQ